MNKANGRKKGNKIRQARKERSWIRCQKRKELRKLLGGHRRAESFKSKWKDGKPPAKMITVKGGRLEVDPTKS